MLKREDVAEHMLSRCDEERASKDGDIGAEAYVNKIYSQP